MGKFFIKYYWLSTLLAFSLTRDNFKSVILELEKPKKVWVATIKVKLRGLEGERTIAIVINASFPEDATEIDYLVTNKQGDEITGEWVDVGQPSFANKSI